jgi:hypothetical protein
MHALDVIFCLYSSFSSNTELLQHINLSNDEILATKDDVVVDVNASTAHKHAAIKRKQAFLTMVERADATPEYYFP